MTVAKDDGTSEVVAGPEKAGDEDTSEVHVTVAEDEDATEIVAGPEKADDEESAVAVIQVASVMRVTPT